MKEEETFIYDAPNLIGTEEFFKKSILPTKRKVEHPLKYLTELIDWNKKHIDTRLGTHNFSSISEKELELIFNPNMDKK